MEQPNLLYIKQLAGDDKAFEDKFITILKEEFPTEQKEYFHSLEEERFRDTALIVHKLKHKLNILGLEEGYGIAVVFEEELRKGKATYSDEFESILKTIETYLKTI
ncbi:MAG: Hpt domain-containing protein [Muriicola sp.]|nr:Hpt domain-containing protein [Muriicola sp.]NNK10930.1 Hpt domain-containing protein [Flavobacteriaceae bacterium]